MTISLAENTKETGSMLLVGMNSWIQSSTGAIAPDAVPSSTRSTRRPGALRAGIATALVALALMVGIAHPAETAAYKSTSTVCTTLEAGFNYASDMALAAQRAGDGKSANYWIKISFALQGTYLDLNCSYGNYEGQAV
jgi:hypothetical protein